MDLARLWIEIQREAGIAAPRADFRFDPDLYLANNEDMRASGMRPEVHWTRYGRAEGRPGNLYGQAREQVPDLGARLRDLARDPRLLAALDSGEPDAEEMVFETLALGGPVDLVVSDFSGDHYADRYPDVLEAGQSPLVHYLVHAEAEGRSSLVELRRGLRRGAQAFDPARPTCLVATHEFARHGGAPVVALRVARAAARTHNVVAVGTKGGGLEEDFLEHVHLVAITDAPMEIGSLGEPAIDAVEFAILNSVECFPFMRMLIARDVPFASYIHEFTHYTRPAAKAITMALFSDLLVFSSSAVRGDWGAIFADVEIDLERDTILLPQEDLVQGSVSEEEMSDARARLSELLGTDLGARRLILGAGAMQWRKGTDIFAMAAAGMRRADPEAVLLWVGDGRNHEELTFGAYLEKHFEEAREGDPEGNFFHLPAGEWYRDAVRAADALFVSSRLDPLPNVAFDAMRHGARVLAFEGATGFDDPRYEGAELLARVPFGDLGAACEALAAMPRKAPGPPTPPAPEAADVFEAISGALKDRLAAQTYIASGGGAYDVPILYGDDLDSFAPHRVREREKLWTYGRNLMWRSADAAREALAASGNWVHQSIDIEPWRGVEAEGAPPFSAHIHAHYTDGLEEDLRGRPLLRHASRIVATTDTVAKAERIRAIAARAGLAVEARVVPNKGRDILPFLDLIAGDRGIGDEEVWCHLHQKKSLETTGSGGVWREFLVTLLLGEMREEGAARAPVSSALWAASREGVGLAAALDPFILGWTDSRRLLGRVAPRLPGPLPERPLLFPVGNMFFARARVVRAMRALFPEGHPWPNEPIPSDGTPFHLIERLWPAVTAAEGLRSVFLDKPGQRRV